MKHHLLNNPCKLPVGGRVVEWRAEKPYRIYLECGMMLRLNAMGVYVPEQHNP